MKNTLLIVCLIATFAFGQDLPKTMMKIEVRLESPDVPPDSFGAKPKVRYRAGSRYCRIEEMPDPDHGIHGTMILNEPDFWIGKPVRQDCSARCRSRTKFQLPEANIRK